MTKAIRITTTGGPEVMQLVNVDPGEPGPGQVRVRHHAIGVNFIDIYVRTGQYPVPLPSGLGVEGAGVVEAVGANVMHLKIGDRVAYNDHAPGAYAQARVMSALPLVKLPDSIPFEQAAAMMLRGLTAQCLVRNTYTVKPGDAVLIHAAAGGVGLLACQFAKLAGATVIGTVSSDEKAALALAHGCDAAVIPARENLAERVRALTDGRGVAVVYDSIGKDTFSASLDCLRPLGLMVNFGTASGPIPPFDSMALLKRGSLFYTRMTLASYLAAPGARQAMAATLFDQVLSGQLRVGAPQRHALADVAEAHRAMEARRTVGATILIP